MNFEQQKQFCTLFHASHYVPIFIYKDGDVPVYGCTAVKDLVPSYYVYKNLLSEQNPHFYFSPETGMWGRIVVPKLSCSVVFGPVFSGDVTREILQGFMNWHGFPMDRTNEIWDYLKSIPKYSYYRFLNMLAYLHFSLNDEVIDIIQHFDHERVQYVEKISKAQTENAVNALEESQGHGTYALEQQLIDLVRNGDVDKLRAFLTGTLNTEKLQEGKLSENPIRQAKNIFIGSVTMFGKSGAIKGGLDVEETYQLIDTYIQECEQMSSIDAIAALHFNMLIDFTSRVAANKIPEGISEDIYACTQFINNHANEPIGIDEVALHINKSRAYLTKKFKSETGKTVNEYILDKKLSVSKSFLKHTNKSLSEIAYFLCFSSQAYFQTTFKNKYGETPGAYRKRFNKI